MSSADGQLLDTDRPVVELFVRAAVDKMKVGGCPICHRYFLALYVLRDQGFIDLVVTTFLPENPPKEVLAFSSGRQFPLVRVQGGQAGRDRNVRSVECETVEEIEIFLEQFRCEDLASRRRSKAENEAEMVFEDLYMMPAPSDTSGLIKMLEKIDAYLRNKSSKFMLSDRLTRADCYVIPVLQHLRVAGKAYKNFEIPTELFFLWRYMKSIYETDAMSDTCPADREIITHYQLKASGHPQGSKSQLLGDERTFSVPNRSLYLNDDFEDLL